MNLSTILHRAATSLATAAFAATLSLAAPQAAQAVVSPPPPVADTFTTFQFTGVCDDCFLGGQPFAPVGVNLPPEGVATATLVLKNFTGDGFDTTNFVRFSYQSILMTFDSTAAHETLTLATGVIPSSVLGFGNIFLTFVNDLSGATTHFQATTQDQFDLDIFTGDVTFAGVVQSWCVTPVNQFTCNFTFDVGSTYSLTEIATVPEPATLALLGAGLLGLGATRRRRG